jgi:4'-phosphopantetheinyl transferase EntD
LLPAGVAAVESTTSVSDATLTVTERALVASAVPDRVREFATGRWCALQSLSKLGIVGFSLLADPSRAPICLKAL